MKPQKVYKMVHTLGKTYGPKERFYHFFYGYLLPSIDQMTKIATEEPSCHFLMESCGPLMDEKAREIIPLSNLSWEIIEDQQSFQLNSATVVEVKRWDVLLREMQFFQGYGFFLGILKKINLATKSFFVDSDEHRYKERYQLLRQKKSLLRSLKSTRNIILSWIDRGVNMKHLDIYDNKFLLLKRSPPPESYQQDGGWSVRKYGSSRRGLMGLENAAKLMNDNGIPCAIFEAGAFSLPEQIAVFHACRGVIGIYGAEFANLIWMKPKRQAIVVNPREASSPSIVLAPELDIFYKEIPLPPESYPELTGKLLESVIEIITRK
ncbi:MAG: glycosyltransferase family 61 protein [Okeania sp. SIO2F4]|uniref:glycosyltransferase 61 family protein n=1 Tax=Okeania sp. SIO2F4 TaxID=2607790 RepID=UPI00142B3487|nr:glycosyltransferase 61 family protein [Okeania sp. SIO2F4]NES01634.1 glycosyltransferase family 61 protein [Okeania sp. SIO2F4]